MKRKLAHLRSLADSAQAQLTQIGQDLRDARERHHALDRHRQTMKDRKLDLSAPDAEKLAETKERIAFLSERHAAMRADHKAKRQLLDRCEREAADAR